MLVAKYKFDKSIYENFIPVFNDGYNGYTVSDEIDSENSNHVIRTIESDVLPTSMRFGSMAVPYAEGSEVALLEILDINTSELTSAYRMFRICKNLTSINCNWDTSKITDMYAMFYDCQSLTSLDVSNWDTSNVTDMNSMFYNCRLLPKLDLSNWNTNNVTNMLDIFHSCSNLTLLDISNFNITNITDAFNNMFFEDTKLQYIRCNNTSTINTLAPLLPSRTSSTQGKIITTSSTNVDTTTLSSKNWSIDTSSGTKIAEYVYDKSIWNYLVPEFNEGYSGYFCNDVIEDEVNSPNVVTRELVGYGGLPTLMRFGTTITDGNISVANTYSLLEILNMNTSALETMQMMFYRCCNVSRIDCDWDISKVTNMYATFSQCTNLTSLDVSNFNTGNVTNMESMFNGCKNLTSLDVSNFDTSKVTSISYMFNGCNLLTTLDVSNFDTSKVTTMQGVFNGCTNLTSLDVSNFDTSKVTTMKYMFGNCHILKSLDVSNFNTSNVTNMENMFRECNNLTLLDVSNWNTSKVTNMAATFRGCQSLTLLDVSNFDTNKVIDMRMMFNSTSKLSDIGMLYCSQDTINKVIPLITNGSKTIWVKDTKASDYTATDYVTFKDYKEDNRTLYLNSPLLEGDEIVNKDGGLYHYHKMGMVVLDGDEEWNHIQSNDSVTYGYIRGNPIEKTGGKIIADKVKPLLPGNTQEGITISNYGGIYFHIGNSKLSTTDVNGFRQYLSENPTTVVYELAEPYYELISDDPLIVKSYTEGKLDTSSIITPTSIQFIPYEEELTYLYTSTQYCIQFNSTANCTVDITLGGTKVENKSVSVGLNKIYITTPSTLVDNKLIINAKGSATISEVVVVNSNTEFDYFDGIKSSFEDCLVTDVDNENYGKYEVGVKIVGKNKFKGWKEKIYMKSNTHYSILSDVTTDATRYNIRFYNKNNENVTKKISIKNISAQSNLYYNPGGYFRTGADSTYIRNIFIIYGNFEYAKFYYDDTPYLNVRLEEISAVSIPYEPYKETNATIYLNSPLLQGDRIEVVDGKLCHYHKAYKVVLDGSNDETWIKTNNSQYSDTILRFDYINYPIGIIGSISDIKSDKFIYMHGHSNVNDVRKHEFICIYRSANEGRNEFNIWINKNRLATADIYGFRQWLSEDPTTVVCRLAKPYYEDITPIQSSFVISTVSEGDMEIITDLPIKSNITYLTNIASAVLMEQQLDELDNSTESLTNIVEDEINE